jgi:hypothetical protein
MAEISQKTEQRRWILCVDLFKHLPVVVRYTVARGQLKAADSGCLLLAPSLPHPQQPASQITSMWICSNT